MSHKHPQTVDEAVDFIIGKLTQADKAEITGLNEKDLRGLHFSLGQYIRNETGLWSGNTALLLDCEKSKGGIEPVSPSMHQDDASTIITRALWLKLRGQ